VICIKTLPELAKELKTAVSTLRYRMLPYAEFLDYVKNRRGKAYTDETEAIVREINTYIIQGKQKKEIIKILSKKNRQRTVPLMEHKLNDDEKIIPTINEKINDDAITKQTILQEINDDAINAQRIQQQNNDLTIRNILTAITNIPEIEKYIGCVLYTQARQVI